MSCSSIMQFRSIMILTASKESDKSVKSLLQALDFQYDMIRGMDPGSERADGPRRGAERRLRQARVALGLAPTPVSVAYL